MQGLIKDMQTKRCFFFFKCMIRQILQTIYTSI